MAKKKRKIRSMTAICVRLGALLFALWFLCMSMLTLGTAQYVFEALSDQGLNYAEYALMSGRLDNWFSTDDEYTQSRRDVPGAVEYNMNMAITRAKRGITAPSFDGYPSMENTVSVFKWGHHTCDTAIVFLDKDGNIVRESSDFIYFPYITQDQWENGIEKTSACGWIDISDASDSRYFVFRHNYNGHELWWDYHTIRITGYLDGSRIEPVAMAVLNRGAYDQALEAVSSDWNAWDPDEVDMIISEDAQSGQISVTPGTQVPPPYTASELDRMGVLEWYVRFDHTAQADPAKELLTVYAQYPEIMIYEPEGPVQYGEKTYDTLLSLLKTRGYFKSQALNQFLAAESQFDLWNMIVFSDAGIYDLREYATDGSTPFPDAEYTVVTAMQANPLKIAMGFLQNAYIITFALALIGFLWISRSVRKHLVLPVQRMTEGMSKGWVYLRSLIEKEPKWKEPFELWSYYRENQDTLHHDRQEITRLNTALEYAKAAEENRRQMTSNIAHELKTPLAIIHSYSEGLKENINAEKKEQYLDTILSESERMDAMVLEMLDLSRLEAGKVKLQRDQFSLSALTKEVFDTFAPMAEEKGLQVTVETEGDCPVVADEARIGQVIRNYASNAVRYTPEGGTILVRVRPGVLGVMLTVENSGCHFTEEELNKVWESFYRSDKSRDRKGTGLGLAIVKNIVALHGGKCGVRNTQHGVEFSLILK